MLATALPSPRLLQHRQPRGATHALPGLVPPLERRPPGRRLSGGGTPQAARRLVQRSTTPPRPKTPPTKPVLRMHSEWQGHELLRVMTVSDLHVDYAENMRWIRGLDSDSHSRDVLVLCGDISDELGALEAALALLASKFMAVFYVPGNHELWVREPDRQAGVADSVAKLRRILELCRGLGVHTRPRRLGDLWIVPLLSWHHRSWDREPDIPSVPPPSPWTIADYGACAWPPGVPGGDEHGSEALAAWFDSLNEGPEWEALLASRPACDVISFSHFLPHQALLPEKRYLYYPALPAAVGSQPLAARLARLRPDLHLFGHTHFAWDACIGGTRYIQAPLCSPLERRKRLFTVSFGACLDEAEADPEAALWLPQQVYVGLAPPLEERHAVAASASQDGDGREAAVAAASMDAGGWRQAAASSAAAAEPQGSPGSNGTGPQRAARQWADTQQSRTAVQVLGPPQAGRQEQQQLSDPLPPQQLQEQADPLLRALQRQQQLEAPAPSQQLQQQQQEQQEQEQQQQQQQQVEPPLRQEPCTRTRPRDQLQIECELRYGWQPLRHGAAVPSLMAHWSMYYEMNARRPEIVELAPWVEKIWRRRRQRARAGALSRTVDSGMMTSGGETALSSLSESGGEFEGGEGGKAAAGVNSALSSGADSALSSMCDE